MHISRSIFGIFLQLNIPTCSTHRDLPKNALKSVTLWNTYKKLIFVEVGVEPVTLPLVGVGMAVSCLLGSYLVRYCHAYLVFHDHASSIEEAEAQCHGDRFGRGDGG